MSADIKNTDDLTPEPTEQPEVKEERAAYEAPKVQSLKLSKEAAEALT